MEPVRVQAQADEQGGIVVEAYDARDLLRQGNEALSAGEYAEAVGRYGRLVSEFHDSALVSAAYYNAALCLVRLNRIDEAAERFLT